MINIENFNTNLLLLHKNIDIYHIRYITITDISNYESIHSVNPVYFIVGK